MRRLPGQAGQPLRGIASDAAAFPPSRTCAARPSARRWAARPSRAASTRHRKRRRSLPAVMR